MFIDVYMNDGSVLVELAFDCKNEYGVVFATTKDEIFFIHTDNHEVWCRKDDFEKEVLLGTYADIIKY